MKGIPTVFLALFAFATFGLTTSADAQYRSNRALQFGVKLGASSYSGDVGPAPPGTASFDATWEVEAFYRFNRWLNIGVKQSTGAYPSLDGPTKRRQSTAIGIRSYFLRGRFAPYLQVGASRSYGGESAGMGLSSAVGAEIALSRRLALFQEFSFDTVSPDEAFDGEIGGRSFDLFGRLGVGLRFSVGKVPGVMRIDRIKHPTVVEAGKVVSLEAVLAHRPRGDVQVDWELPGGVIYTTNPIEHTFGFPGQYEFDVVATSADGKVSRRMTIEVLPSAEALAEAEVDTTIGTVEIDNIYGPRMTVAGTSGTYRVRIAPGAVQPVEYWWEMSDGSTVQGNSVSHTFDQSGTYAIRAWVRNEVGADSMTIAILVDPAEVESAPIVAEIRENIEQAAAKAPEPTPIAVEVVEPENELPPVSSDDPPVVVIQAPPTSGIDLSLGGYTWVVESLPTKAAAEARTDGYKALGFPVGVYEDSYNGKTEFHVVIGQSATKRVAESIGARIQRHVPARIWLLELSR
jgi:hypothetical protein